MTGGRKTAVLTAGAGIALMALASGFAGAGIARAAGQSCREVPVSAPSKLCRGRIDLDPAIPAGFATNPNALGISEKTGGRMADCFAWESFVALNWPGTRSCRGVPSNRKGTADWTSNRVWETYKEPYELFQATNETWDPALIDFNDAPPEGPCGDLTGSGRKLLRHANKFPLSNEDAQAFLDSAVLRDQNGNAVWYEILMNRDVFDYIRDSGLAATGAYSFGGPLDGENVDFPTAADGASGTGAIEIKAAWRQMTDADDLARYFTQDAVVYDSVTCTETTVGLVGLHIARKVAFSPKWIWATFEHEDNVPPAGSNGDGRSYSFFSKYCAKNEPANCPYEVAITDVDNICCPNLITFPGPNPALSINQVTRLTPIQAWSKINRRYRRAYRKAGSPFRHFVLVGAQWAKPRAGTEQASGGRMPAGHAAPHFPGSPWQRPCNPNGPWAVEPPSRGEACYEQIPSDLRNTSMETLFVQTDRTGTQYSADSCMNCHFAGGIDGSYLWLDAMLNPYRAGD
ncbi:hypothetical protein [Microbaculum marinum]|uniref:Cytochrome c family protein n=1 Tax=Microbaculum marinum TaxID=1764581 RepID=A0AAW9RLE1_9HYPH